MCRDPIAPEATCLEAVLQATPPQTSVEEKEEIFISDQVRSWQKEMARLLQQQEERGGVIDPTAKDDVIDETWVRPLPPPSEQSDVNPEERGRFPILIRSLSTPPCRSRDGTWKERVTSS